MHGWDYNYKTDKTRYNGWWGIYIRDVDAIASIQSLCFIRMIL